MMNINGATGIGTYGDLLVVVIKGIGKQRITGPRAPVISLLS